MTDEHNAQVAPNAERRHKAIAAAWAAWHSRHGGKLGPGPAFCEAIDAALAALQRDAKKD